MQTINEASLLSRRQFLKLATSTAAGLTAYQMRHLYAEGSPYPAFHGKEIKARLLHSPTGQADTNPALTRRFPWLRYGNNPGGRVQIANAQDLPTRAQAIGQPGEAVFEAGGVQVIPWAPMFERPTHLREANRALKALAGTSQLYIKDEGSESAAIYGNKIRKYEFLLPNLAAAGVRQVVTHGAFGSNHCAHLALAARYGTYRPGGEPGGIESEFYLYPQEMTANAVTKLKLLVASGARLNFLEGDAAVALSITKTRLQARYSSTEACVNPGGSSPLAVLGHVEAIMELAEQIESGACSLTSPPDFIFCPLGSGATSIGLALGCFILGWPTKVVGTCSQDKGIVARALVNGDISAPFLIGNAHSLAESGLKWLHRLGLPDGKRQQLTSREILERHFAYDAVTWLPEYGCVTPEIQAEATAAKAAGLVLDNTFTAKSFHTLKAYAGAGLLKGKSAVFWNTYQRFPLDKLLPADTDWTMALPPPIKSRVVAFLRANGGMLV